MKDPNLRDGTAPVQASTRVAALFGTIEIKILSGFLLANLTRFVSPSYMNWVVSGDILLMVVLGGMGTLIGPIVGAIVWLSLEETLSSFSLGLPWGSDEFIRDHWMIVLGALVIVAALHLKAGLYGYLIGHDEASS